MVFFSVQNPLARSDTLQENADFREVFKRLPYHPDVHVCSMTSCVSIIRHYSLRNCPPNIVPRQCSFSLLSIASMHFSSGYLLAFPRIFPGKHKSRQMWESAAKTKALASALHAYSNSNNIF